jgi:hypothetical protein
MYFHYFNMRLIEKHINKIIFALGFFAALPFFFIPRVPFIYINKINSNSTWIDQNIIPYPGYTDSLGLASPFILVMITITFFFSIIFYEEKNYKRNVKLIFLSGLLVITNTIILYVLSSSLKSLSASSSLIGLFLILIIIIKNKDKFNIFCEGFLISLVFFINLHALSLLVTGIKFSFASEGISIFGIEIYQSIVSYSTLVSFFFGTLVLKKNLLHFSSILENKIINNLIYFITLFSCLIVVLFLSRRLAFLICLFYLFIWIILNLNKIRKKFPISIYFFMISIFSIIFVINNFFFTGSRSINYEFMIKPRLSNIYKTIKEILIGNDFELLLGKMKGWGNIENGYLDILLNSGIVGFISVFITLIILFYGLSKKIGILIIKKQKPNIILSFFVLCFIGIVNNPISTPYFFVSFFIILIIALGEKNEKMTCK